MVAYVGGGNTRSSRRRAAKERASVSKPGMAEGSSPASFLEVHPGQWEWK